jgi:hypothetical protein
MPDTNEWRRFAYLYWFNARVNAMGSYEISKLPPNASYRDVREAELKAAAEVYADEAGRLAKAADALEAAREAGRNHADGIMAEAGFKAVP